MKPKFAKTRSLLPLIAVVATCVPALSATYDWSLTTGSPAAWNAEANWTTNPGPDDGLFPSLAGDVANVTSNIDAAFTINLNQPITLGTLNLSDPTINADPTPAFSAFTIAANGGALTMDNSGSGASISTTAGPTAAPSITHVISAGIALNDSLSINPADFNNLQLSGVVSGTNNITKTGAGSLVLGNLGAGGNNTYTGSFTIANGTVNVQKNSAFGGTVNSISLGSADSASTDNITLRINDDGGVNLGQSITVNNNNSSGVTTLATDGNGFGGGDTANWTGLITLNRDLQITAANNGFANFNGTGGQKITGTGNVATGSQGIIGLSGPNDFTGNFTIGASSKVRIGTDSTGAAGAVTSGPFGKGTLTVTGGTSGSTADNSGIASTLPRTILNNVIFSGNKVRFGDGTNNGAITLQGSVTLNGTVEITTSASTIINGVIDDGASTFGITKGQDPGTLTLNNANTYNGTNTLKGDNGTVAIGNNAAFGTGNIAYSLFAGTLTQNLRSTDTSTRSITNTFSTLDSNNNANLTLGFGSTNSGENGNLEFSSGLNLGSETGTTNTRNFNVRNTTTFGGGISNGNTGTFTVNKDGAGTLVWNGNNTYNGPTNINVGTLLVNNILSTNANAVTVAANATLGGTGTIRRAITVNTDGILAPGTSAGTLTVEANVSGTGKLAIELDGANADKLVATGAAVVNVSGLNLNVTTLSGGATQAAYIIVDSVQPITGNFASTGTLPPGYSIDYAYNDGSDTNNIALVTGVVADPFDTWATTTNGLVGANAEPTADPDNDGLDNAVEFVVGGQPNPANPGANSAGLLIAPVVDANNLVFTYRRTDLSLTQPGIGISVEYGSNLTGWATAQHGVDGVTIVETNDFYGSSPGVDKVEVTIPKTLAGSTGKLFSRLKVVIP